MIKELDPKSVEKPVERCAECDRETTYYNQFLAPTGETRVICWECLARDEKGFNAAKGFSRSSRRGVIPR